MKKHLFRVARLAIIIAPLLIVSCERVNVGVNDRTETSIISSQPITVSEAKAWFEQEMKTRSVNKSKSRSSANTLVDFPKEPYWKFANEVKVEGINAVVTQFKSAYNQPEPRIRPGNGNRKEKLSDQDDHIGVDEFSDLIIYKKGEEKIAEVITKIPDDDFYKQQDKSSWKFSGYMLISDLDGRIKKSFRFDNGTYTGDVFFNEPPRSANGRPASMYVCGYIDWYNLVCMGSTCSVNYDRTDTIYCSTGDGGSQGGSGPTATGYSGSIDGSAATGSNGGFAIVQTDADKPVVDPFQQVRCFMNNTNDYTYELIVYIDQPGEDSGSSSSWGDVGHAFVSLKKTSNNNGSVIRRTFGFYPRDSWAAIPGTGGRLHTNEDTEYDVSIRYPLSPQQMTNAANSALSNATHTYELTQYNCTNYVKSICDAAGVSLPVQADKMKPNGSELWFLSPGKTGQALRNASGSNPNITVRSAAKPENAPFNLGDCQ